MSAGKRSLPGLLVILVAMVVFIMQIGVFADEDGYYVVRQGAEEIEIAPLEGSQDAIEFYGYDETTFVSGLPYLEANTATLFLYREMSTTDLWLFMLFGGPDGDSGATKFEISGIPDEATIPVKDDEFDIRDVWEIEPPTASLSWFWDTGNADGCILGPLGSEFELTIYPEFTGGIDKFRVLSGDVAAPSEIEVSSVGELVLETSVTRMPTAGFTTAPIVVHIDEPCTFDASISEDVDGRIVEYGWDFDGDGVFELTSTDEVAKHTYTTSGVKDVTLRVTDEMGGVAYISQSLEIGSIGVSVSRQVSTSVALPGSTFTVDVRIEASRTLAGAGLQETVPAGWKVRPVENAGAAFKRSSTEWVFVDEIKGGSSKVISYEVEIPNVTKLVPENLPNTFGISGRFESMAPVIDLSVEGDSSIEVGDSVDVGTAIAHLVGIEGDGDQLDFGLRQTISPDQLEWAVQLWSRDLKVPGTRGAMISLGVLKELCAYAETQTPIDEDLPAVPEVGVRAVRSVTTSVACGNVLVGYYDVDGGSKGNTFMVKLQVSSDEDMYGVGVSEELPENWKATPVENDGFIYRESKNEWMFPSKVGAGDVKEIVYQVMVPQTETAEGAPSATPSYVTTNDVFGSVLVGLPCQQAGIVGNSEVHVTNELPVLVAISRWDVDNDAVDISLSDKISFEQVQRAVAFWLEDQPVAETGGKLVTYDVLKTIIAHWLTDTKICGPLPMTIQQPCGEGETPCGQ